MKKVSALAVLVTVVMGASVLGACGSSSGSGFNGLDSGGGGLDATGDHTLFDSGEGGIHLTGDSGTGSKITIKPANPVLNVTIPGPPATQKFQAFEIGDASPVSATWSIDNAALGTIDASGKFTASGTLAGIANIGAMTSAGQGKTTIEVTLAITDNTGSIPSTTQTQLQGGGSADSAFTWLYPYNNTVFPRGLTPPVLQFAGTAADATYVHITSKDIDYKGYFGPSSPTQITLSAATWATIVGSAGGTDTLKVDVTKTSGGAVTGPITQTWTIATGSLKGTVYYNSYDSALGGGQGTILKMKPGTPASVLLGGSSGCMVCHAVSGDGSTLTASNGDYVSGQSFALSPSGATSTWSQPNNQFSFTGLYPDGSLLLSNATISGSWPPNVPGVSGAGTPAQLINPKTGAVISAPGFDGVVTSALMPSFAPDGTKVVFNHYDTGTGHSLAVMDFLKATSTFSGLVDIASDPSLYLGWPAFLPDSKEVIYHLDSGADFATWDGDTADIYIADVASKTMTKLNALDGYDSMGNVYLPYGASESNMNYEPTVLPVAVGGYYWVVFTSRREYGNTITASNPWQQSPAIRKKLWVAAIDINPTPGKDPSHPAFYINDQELEAGNMRGFWALDPCQQNGTMCGSGDECCSGFCRSSSGDSGTTLTCSPPTGGCAHEYEKCTTSANCCGEAMGFQCINGFCASPAPK